MSGDAVPKWTASSFAGRSPRRAPSAGTPEGGSPAPAAVYARLLDIRLLGRHQAAAAVATGIDFATMVGLVELAGAPPPLATLLSAMAGGLSNFALGRGWAFRDRHRGSVSSQAARYALVCAGGALLNASLLGVVLGFAHPNYVIARAVVSILVSIAYTYPMHARFVFRAVREAENGGAGIEPSRGSS